MKNDFLKQNAVIFLSLILLTIFFIGLIFVGSRVTYYHQTSGFHEDVDAQLTTAQRTIQVFFSSLKRDLFFLKSIKPVRNYIDSGFKSSKDRVLVERTFYNFGKINKFYYQIRIINNLGQEIVRIDNPRNRPTTIISKTDLQNKAHRYYFKHTMQLNKNQLYLSPIDLNYEEGEIETPYIPVIRLATPLFNANNQKVGIMILSAYFPYVLNLLPKGVFIQTADGNQISMKKDGTVLLKKSLHVFKGAEGELLVNNNHVHFKKIQYLPGKTFVIALVHKLSSIKRIAFQHILVLFAIFSLFTIFLVVFSYRIIKKSKVLIKTEKAIIFSLVKLAEWRDPETGAHLMRTRNYAIILVKELRKNKKYKNIITNEFVEVLYDAAPLHDIGKVGIPDAILLKESKLTDDEFCKMKKHVLIGKKEVHDIITKYNLKEPFLLMAKDICAYHHEKYDGTGYLKGIQGEKIPLSARIFSLCDAYDVIRSKRPYKEPLSHKEAIRRINLDRGKHFDPDIVDAFLSCEKEFLKTSEKFKD